MRSIEFVGNDMLTVWRQLLIDLVNARAIGPRGLATRELTNVTLNLTDAFNNVIVHPRRKLNYRFMVAEWLWVLFGRNDLATIARYNARMREFSDDGVTLAGAYGPSFNAQVAYVCDALRRDPETRRAVLTFWRPAPDLASRDIPCTIGAQFLVRDGELIATFTMRSSDAWLGVPYDAFTFTMLASYVRGLIIEQVKLGPVVRFILNIGSSHLYETNVEGARDVLAHRGEGHYVKSHMLWGHAPPELENVLENPKNDWLDFKFGTQPTWDRYAHVLKSKTSSEALSILDTDR